MANDKANSLGPAVLRSIRDYVRLAAPEPEVLRIIGEESRKKGTDKLTPRQIDRVINSARAYPRSQRSVVARRGQS